MDLTNIQQLSGLLEGKLRNFTFTEILTSIRSLSGIPAHPYEQAKYKYFGKDYKFPTINDIPEPLDFNYKSNARALSGIFEHTHQISLSALSALETKIKEASDSNKAQDLLNRSSIENFILQDENIIKNNIEFSEIIRSISLDDIEVKPIEIAQKLLSHYVKLF